MANDTIQILDVATGELVIREMTDAEQALRNAEIEQWKSEKQARQDAIETSWRTKVSAFTKMGLTPQEIEELAPTPKWLQPEENAETL